jgi:PAS domain S-box-containing protein
MNEANEPLRLFLVEDDDNVAFVMRKSLERFGHEVTTCRTGADALIVLSHSTFNLVLLDNQLPDMSGLELLDHLNRERITTPVMMVTGTGGEHLAANVLRAGAIDYIAKGEALTFLADLPKRVGESVERHRLQQLNQLLIEALESARDGIMITDLQANMLHVNKALEQMTGYDRQEMLGNTPRLFNSGVHDQTFFTELWQTILSRHSWQGELTNRRKDGTLFDASLSISPLVNRRGQLTHFVSIFRDVSEHKQLERQLRQAQKMQSIGTLAGGVAHEFNNLLAGIQGYAALGLRENDLSPALKEFLQYIVELSDRAAHLTRQLLAFARKPNLSPQPTLAENLVRRTAELVQRSLCMDVRLDVQPLGPDGKPLAAMADDNQLQQVLVNLALNARDAQSEPSALTFRLRQEVLSGELTGFPEHVPAGDFVVLEVQDTGCGMSAEVLNQALDPFFTTKEVGKGTGLGLPVAYGIVHGHQGYMTINSAPGKGTRVSLYLPRLVGAAVTRHKPVVTDGGHVVEPDQVPARKILVVDDEQAVLDVMRRFLEIAGHEVICLHDGDEALNLLSAGEAVDLVILDLMIPREDGVTTYRRIRQHWPIIPVLLCTGLLQSGAAPQLMKEGAAGLLRKPFRMNELWYAVNQALSHDAD